MDQLLPKVSVITITYEHQDYILDTIKGVLMQEYKGEIEFIIADDNSPDNTYQVVTEFLNTNPLPPTIEIKYTKQEENLGVIPNFMWALQQATGKYLALCEGDDYWIDPLKLQKQVAFLEANLECSLCFTAKNNVDVNGNFISVSRQNRTIEPLDVIKGNFTIPIQTVLLRNMIYEYVDLYKKLPNFTGGDRILAYFFATKGKLGYIDEVTAIYRIHDGGVWSRLSERQKMIAHLREHTKFLNVIAKDQTELKHFKTLSYAEVVKLILSKCATHPLGCLKHIVFLYKNYDLSPRVFVIAAKDIFSYYWGLRRKKLLF